MNEILLLQQNLGYFLLIFARVSGIFTSAPFFGSRNIPVYIKAGMSFIFAVILLPVIMHKPPAFPNSFFPFLMIVIGEFLVGLIFGFAASMVFSAIQMAGQILDMQIGFGIVNIFDVQSGQQMPLIGNFKYILALTVFVATNGHHILISALFSTFDIIPIAGAKFTGPTAGYVVDMVAGMFIFAMKISMPVLAAIMLTDVALGILARTMPQMNIFVVGVPAKIIVGVFMLSLALPAYIYILEVGFNGMYRDIYHLLQTIH